MPSWLVPALRWGGLALAVIFAIALITVEQGMPGAEAGPTAAPVTLYWILLVVGVAAAVAGFSMGRGKPEAGGEE